MQIVKISDIKPNPKNPRTIKDANFEKLCKSLQEFPEMLHKRPLVCYTDVDVKLVVLGGNMRLKAAKEVGMKELPVELCDDWTAEQRELFVLRDNVSGGEWEFEELTDWQLDELKEWGVQPIRYDLGHEANNLTEDDLDLDEEFDPIGKASGLHTVTIIFDGKDEAESWLKNNQLTFVKFATTWKVNLSTRFTLSAREGLNAL